jgi:hypothetical protein
MYETDDPDARSVESDSSSSYESYSSRGRGSYASRGRGSDSRPQLPQRGGQLLSRERFVASSATSEWMHAGIQGYDEHYVKGNEGVTSSHPYLDDEALGGGDNFYDELYLGAPQGTKMASESLQEMLDHSSASSGYLQDEQSPTIPGDPSTKTKFGSILCPTSRAERQRCKKRSYQIAVVAILMVTLLCVTLGITVGVGRGNDAPVQSSQPAETISPPSNTSDPFALGNTTSSNSTIPGPDSDSSGQSAQKETAEQVVEGALASTSRNATQRPAQVRWRTF